MDNTPMFSVIVPAYNQGRFLGKALDSLLDQTEKDWEAIIVNDGSTDSTIDVASDYCKKDKRFHVISKENGGVASALNAGLDNAKGEWICWLSSDDLFNERKLEIHKRWIKQFPDTKFFFTSYRLLYDETGKISEPDVHLLIPETRWQVIEMIRSNYISGNSVCIHKKSWLNIGRFNGSLRYGQDYDMWLRLLAAYPAVFIPERTCMTRIHKSQGTYGFPEAGIYDASKSAIIYLKDHDFPSLFPCLNLKDISSARSAIIKAVDIASDPASWLYSLGPHPTLIFRCMDWAYNTSDSTIRSAIMSTFKRRIRRSSGIYKGTYLGHYLKIASLMCTSTSFEFNFDTVSYLDILKNNYYAQIARHNIGSESIGRYIDKFENTTMDELALGTLKCKYILIVDTEESAMKRGDNICNARAMAKFFMRTGRTSTIIKESKNKSNFNDGVLQINFVRKDDFKKVLRSNLLWDALFELSSYPPLNDIKTRRSYLLVDSYDTDFNTDIINQSGGFVICASDDLKTRLMSRGVKKNHIIAINQTYSNDIQFQTLAQNTTLTYSHFVNLINIMESTNPKKFILYDLSDNILSISKKAFIVPRLIYMGIATIPQDFKDKPVSEWPHVIYTIWLNFKRKINL